MAFQKHPIKVFGGITMKHVNKSLLGIMVVLLCLAPACSLVPAQKGKTEAPVSAYYPNDEWRNSTPEEQGLDSALILQMFHKIQDKNIDIHSFLLVRNGYLVTEVYIDPYTQNIKHPVFSVTKSVTSILTGIAMHEGYIDRVDQKVLDFFPAIAKNVSDENVQNLTLKHLLTMSAGYNTTTIPQSQVLSQKDASFDTVEHILTYNSILEKPGTTFFYDSGLPHLLSAIIQETTGISTLGYAQEKLFGPLGITGVTWETDPRGIPLGCTGLMLSPRDMAKLGYLYLNRGQWNGEQIVPATWVDQSTAKHIETKGLMNAAEDDGYGYYWWIDAYGGYSSHGFGGQYIFVVPNLNMVAVFTSGLANPDFPTPRRLMEGYILPAATSTHALPPSQATNDLQTYIQRIANPEAQPAPLPAIASQISGRTFQITEKSGPYVEKFTLTFEEGGNLYRSQSTWPEGNYDVLGGLDNRFYVNEMTQGSQMERVALKAYWQDEKTFVETVKNLAQIESVIFTYTFDGNSVTIDMKSSMGSYAFRMKGEMVDH
jgi:CubicO group peptidase (beta-lactamase class C family)